MKKDKTFFLGLMAFGIMALNNTATAYAEWSPNGQSDAMSGYSGQIMLGSADRHNLSDFKRIDQSSSGDGLFGSTSVQAPVTLVAGAAIEIKIMNAGQVVNDYTVNGKECSPNKAFHAFVSPIATCSAVHGRNFSGFRAVAEKLTGTEWRPMLYMNANGRWVDMSDDNVVGVVDADECRKLLVQKICQ